MIRPTRVKRRYRAQAIVETALILTCAILILGGLTDLWFFALSGAKVREIARESAQVMIDARSPDQAQQAATARAAQMLSQNPFLLEDVHVDFPEFDFKPGGIVAARVTGTHHFHFLFAMMNMINESEGFHPRQLSNTVYVVLGPARNF